MQLGAFSISLPVADLAASRRFYEALGFEATGGDADAGWLILEQDEAVIGIFQDMFDEPILTFNPGHSHRDDAVAAFDDVRDIQTTLRSLGIEPVEATDPSATGPAHIVVVDPDGNRIMIDQFVDRPG